MRFAGVFKWMLTLILAAAAAAGAGGVWLWKNSDGLIRSQILATFEKRAPDLTLRFDSLQLLSTSSVRLREVELRDRETNKSLLRVAELEASVDESLLAERQIVVIRSIALKGIQVLLRRSEDGRWNWQNYRFEPDKGIPFIPPTVSIEDLQAHIELEHGEEIPPATLLLTAPTFRAVPSSGEAYDFAGMLALPGAGTLSLEGGCDLVAKTWNLGGRVGGLSANQSLLEMARSTAPQIAEQLGKLDQALEKLLPATADPANAPPAATTSMVIGNGPSSPRFNGTVDVDFHVEKTVDIAVPRLRLAVDVRNGQVFSPALPFRLSDVEAQFFWNNETVEFQLRNARDGDALVTGGFHMDLKSDAMPTASLHLENFPVTMQLKPLLPTKTQKFFDHFKPGGRITGDVEVRRFPNGKWLPVSTSGFSNDGAMEFHKFRSPATDIRARLVQRPLPENAATLNDVIFDVEAEGSVSGRPVTAKGWLRNPGPEIELSFGVHVDGLPLDSRFRDALDDQGRKVIDTLNINGTAVADITCYRSPGLDKPTDIVLNARVSDSHLRFKGFPYDIDRLTGSVEFRSAEKSWTFTDLHGWHGSCELTGAGSFRGLPAPGVLQLTIKAQGANLDADLFNALNESSRAVWSIVNPDGKVNLTAQVAWTALPGQKASIRLDDVTVYDTVIVPKPFPYRMKIRQAKLSYDPNDPRAAGRQHCEILSVEAEHDGAPISASGWAEVGPEGDWQVHLNDVNAIDVKPDDHLRGALPDSWRETLSRLGQTGRISVENSEIDFRGLTREASSPTAAWRMTLRLKNCEVAAGLDLKRVTGIVRASGTWDGVHLENQGDIRLDQVEVLEMIVAGINGPYSINDDELVLGNRDVIAGKVRPGEVPVEQRIQAQAYGGTLEMDGLIDLTAGSSYRFFGELRNALLEEYGQRHMPEQTNLRGVVNSWIFVYGDGDSPKKLQGRGQLQINPAQLYELPMVLEMFSALSRLNFTVPNRTAFNYALMSFDIRDEAFWFDPVDLVGDAISLRGRGRIGFEGDVVLDFFSRPPRPTGPRLPFSQLAMSGATRWVTVQVRGTIDRPQTNVSTRPQLDESMRQLLSTFNPGPGAPIPGLVLPNLVTAPFGPAYPGP